MGIGFMKGGRVSYVTVTVLGSTGGTASGGVKIRKGKQVTITASPSGNYNFTGWYVGNVRLSTAATYTFTAVEDITVQARFALRPGAPGSVVHAALRCSTDANRHYIRIKTSDYNATPVSVTVLQAYSSTGRKLLAPVTIPTRYSVGSGSAGVQYNAYISAISPNVKSNCTHSKSTNAADPEYTYSSLAAVEGDTFCMEYNINF